MNLIHVKSCILLRYMHEYILELISTDLNKTQFNKKKKKMKECERARRKKVYADKTAGW